MMKQKIYIGSIILALICAALLTGCFGRTKQPFVMDQYTLDYTSPEVRADQKAIDELVTVQRFSVAPQFNSTSMMVRTGQYRFDAYDHSRWHVNPADMLTGFILRDITQSGMFKGTYCYYDTELSRYILEGYIDEFGETSDAKAAVGIRITLLDTSQQNPAGQILFQRHYAEAAPISDRSALSLAAGLSHAMRNLSARLINDIGRALNASRRTGPGTTK